MIKATSKKNKPNSTLKDNMVLELELVTSGSDIKALDKRFKIAANIYNTLIRVFKKRVNRLHHSKEYKETCDLHKDDPNRKRRFKELREEYELSKGDIEKYATDLTKRFTFQKVGTTKFQTPRVHIHSQIAQNLAYRALQAIEQMMFHRADELTFHNLESLGTLEGKSNTTGIRFIDRKVKWAGLEMKIRVKKNDTYARQMLTNKVKYCRIVRKTIRGKVRFYVQLVLEGTPPLKLDKEGNFKHMIGTGTVGIDIGVSQVAVTSENGMIHEELAPGVFQLEQKKKRLLRAMDRSRKANNPENFNEDGTVKKGKKKWVNSKHYEKLRFRHKDICRKQKVYRIQAHNRMANQILALGDDVKVEEMNFAGLKKRSKKTEKSKKTGRNKRKKRFGKSIGHRAPASLLLIIDRKLGYIDKDLKCINTKKVAASQYNHVSNQRVKKALSVRVHIVDGKLVQRDLYSSFVLMFVNNDLETINQVGMIQFFEEYLKIQDDIMKKNSEIATPKCMGVKEFVKKVS
ncbi:transposase [Acidaminobacter sp. JC074]|uniref:hypothetical protein n=1 Tax=Acidaminobacter sp. JC074 TaxID=2530199 RepID=UPI001F11482A|nr:hypothetical protein [Acidaminobacter sp. JC074]MCH4887106.1 transposase [Acidaminobacter sp. JC074]